MRSNIVEALVGAVVLGIAGFFLAYAYKSSGTVSGDGYELRAKFDRIDGLVMGNDVKLSGVKVGEVLAINIDPETYLAQVTLSISDKIQLPTDTSVEITSESLMGGKYLAVVPGASEKTLKPGDVIVHTQSSISWEGMIGKFMFSKSDNDDKAESKAK